MLIALPMSSLASDVSVTAVVDATSPTGSVTLSAGGSGGITINLEVSGKQDGTATFKVDQTWTLSGGAFVGSNPATFTVGPRLAGADAQLFSTSGTVAVAAGQAAGTFELSVQAEDVTNTNTTGAKLAVGSAASYSVTVQATSDPCLSVSAPALPVLSPDASSPATGWF